MDFTNTTVSGLNWSNHNTFKVVTELLKSGTSVKTMENKANNYMQQ